jgi:hypothetical protein
MNTRGSVLQSEDYMSAKGAWASKLALGQEDQRIIFGKTYTSTALDIVSEIKAQTKPKEEMPEEQAKPDAYTFHGWAVAASSLDPYSDPCEQSQ